LLDFHEKVPKVQKKAAGFQGETFLIESSQSYAKTLFKKDST